VRAAIQSAKSSSAISPAAGLKTTAAASSLGGVKINAVEPEKYDHGCKRRSFVAVDEWMVLRDCDSI
jgi:hypothetical protein